LTFYQARESVQSSSACSEATEGQPRGLAPRIYRANYTTIEEILNVEEVFTGMFFLHAQRIIILFDFRVSHDFMSSACAKKASLPLVVIGKPYVISTPRSQVNVDCIV
jgi:hypothetical protein